MAENNVPLLATFNEMMEEYCFDAKDLINP